MTLKYTSLSIFGPVDSRSVAGETNGVNFPLNIY